METLKLSIDEIKQLISLKEEYWEYDLDTNCYAFALGLDFPENEIVKNAYQLGIIGATINNRPINQLKKMTFEERLFLDLRTLKINYEEVLPSEKSGFDFYTKNDGITYLNNYWLIALFSNDKNFHFLRKSYDGIWYQKHGYFASPINYDNDKRIITNPKQCNITGYQYIKTYKLKYTERW